MRFLLGVLVGYTVRRKQKLLIKLLVTLLIVYVVCGCRFCQQLRFWR